MNPLLRNALWQQFGAAIDMLENALLACPETHWHSILWKDLADDPLPAEFAAFWYVAYHVLFFLDLDLTGVKEEEFVPPAPFTLSELDPAGVLPERPYTKEELHGYLLSLRKKCQTTILALTDEQAQRDVSYLHSRKEPMSYLELLLYSMRHVQEHGAQLNMSLGQNDIAVIASWVGRAKVKTA